MRVVLANNYHNLTIISSWASNLSMMIFFIGGNMGSSAIPFPRSSGGQNGKTGGITMPGSPSSASAGRVMSFDFGLEKQDFCVKKKNWWLFRIDGISASGITSLPPSKSARPSISFKTMEAIHLNENITRPARPDWKPVNLVLFDLKKNKNPIFEWLKKIYNPETGEWKRPTSNPSGSGAPSDYGYDQGNDNIPGFIIPKAYLELYDGCKNVIETWIYENAWPESIDWSDLDMASGDILMVTISLRYDRAYLQG